MLGLLEIDDGLRELRPSHFLAEATMTKLVTLNPRWSTRLPKKFRAALGLIAGARLAFSQLSDGTVVMRGKHRELFSLAGVLTREGQLEVSIEEMSR